MDFSPQEVPPEEQLGGVPHWTRGEGERQARPAAGEAGGNGDGDEVEHEEAELVPGDVVDPRPEGEVEGERIKTRPFSTGLNLGWQLSPFQKLTATYHFRYDVYKAAPETPPDFVLPTSTATNGVGLTYEYRRGGYTLQGSGFLYRRSSWDPLG